LRIALSCGVAATERSRMRFNPMAIADDDLGISFAKC
jgi:hypothetical protein